MSVQPIDPVSDPRVEHRYATLNGQKYHYLYAVPRSGDYQHTVFLVSLVGYPVMLWRHIPDLVILASIGHLEILTALVDPWLARPINRMEVSNPILSRYGNAGRCAGHDGIWRDSKKGPEIMLPQKNAQRWDI